jgi:hypothetical protein
MSHVPLILALAALLIVPAAFYLRAAARRANLPPSSRNWPIAGIVVGMIVIFGLDHRKVWLLLLGFSLVVLHLLHQACRIHQAARKTRTRENA